MKNELIEEHARFKNAKGGFRETGRALFAVWGREAVQFLNGLVTGDVAKLDDGHAIPIAFPNAQGRLLALARILRQGDRFLIDTDLVTQEKLFANLHRFTFAGDFNLENLTGSMNYFELFSDSAINIEGLMFDTSIGTGVFLRDSADEITKEMGLVAISDDLANILRVEKRIPLFGTDADENTVVPELDITDLISYNKGCYIGQEIIARIHFRGHVAKILRGITFNDGDADSVEDADERELFSEDGKPAGRVTSICFSPRFGKRIGLAMIRYDFREAGRRLVTARSSQCIVVDFPMVSK